VQTIGFWGWYIMNSFANSETSFVCEPQEIRKAIEMTAAMTNFIEPFKPS
jgi:hypothetical protein